MKTNDKLRMKIIGLLMLVTYFFVSASPATEKAKTLNIAVWSDVHLMAPSLLDGLSGTAAGRSDKMLYESEALLDAAFELLKLRETQPDMLIIPGDLTSNGEKASHELLAQKLGEINAYFPGIKIYVIDGNHDVNRNGYAKTYANGYAEDTEWVTDAQFQEIYAGFGYGDSNNEYYSPKLSDYGANSYVARPADGFTLIAIDVDNHSDGIFSGELLDWVIKKAREAQERDDAIIAVMHHGLVPHLTVEPKYWGDHLVQDYEAISQALADAGIHWIFTGDMHANDIALLTTEAGNTIYDIETGSLVTYPSPVRYVALTKNGGKETIHSEIEHIRSIDYTDPHTEEPVTDLEAYYLSNYIDENQLVDMLMEHTVNDLVDSLMTAIAATEYSPAEGVTHTGSRALIESLLGQDIAEVAPLLFGGALPTSESEGVEVDVSGSTLKIWRDNDARRIKISGRILVTGVAAITDENLATYLITPAFRQIDADFLQNSAYMHSMGVKIINDIANYPLPTSDGNHYLLETAFLAFLGHLAGEENPAEWAIEILDGVKYGYVTDVLIDRVFQILLDELNNKIFPAIPVSTNMITHESGSSGYTTLLKIGIAAMMGDMGSLFSTMGINIDEMAGGLFNSSIVPEESKNQLSDQVSEVLESLMFDDNHPEDNWTALAYDDGCSDEDPVDYAEVYDNENNVEGALRIAVWSDLHVLPASLIGENSQSSEFAEAIAGDRKMFAESAAILDAAIEQVKTDAPDVLIIPGDLTKDGEKLSHEYLAGKLGEVKIALPEIKIYVINGDHDVNNHTGSKDYSTTPATLTPTVTPDEFRTIYAGFGYSDPGNEYYTPPAGKYAGGLSYVARPKEGFTFIAIDAGKYSADATQSGLDEHETAGNITPELMDWVLEKAATAKANGDFVFTMVHHGLAPHFSLEPVSFAEYLTDNYEEDAQKLADAGVRYVFTGHSHVNDIAQITTDKGNTLYDIETGSLVTYPSPVRLVSFNKETLRENNYKFDTETIAIITRMIKEIDYTNPLTGETVSDLTVYGRDRLTEPSILTGLIRDALLNDLTDGLIDSMQATQFTTTAGNTHTGSLALLESMLPGDNNDLGDYAVNRIAEQLTANPLTINVPEEEGAITVSFDETERRVVIHFHSESVDWYGYMTDADLRTHLIGKTFEQLDAAYLLNKPFMHEFMSKIRMDVLTTRVHLALPCNRHTILQAVVRAYLGHLAGEEMQLQWVAGIADGLDILQHDGVLLNYMHDKVIRNVMNVELPALLNGITVDLNDLLSGDEAVKLLLATGFDSETPAFHDLLNMFNMDVISLTGNSLNSSIILDEYKAQAGALFSSAIHSFLFDDNYTEDNNTVLYWEGEKIVTSVPEILLSDRIALYPNPVKEELHIETTLDVKEINIYDVYGKPVKQVKGKPAFIPVEELPSGIYFVKLLTEEGDVFVQKAVKQ
ncbi:MAG: metallophosphoesterase [Dysgonamonadaceae bacterium]|jgi:3',5'-cyclic AMP phosphodiesterase CpdA|nr:metallophosphoesterase [Dysgonamonadaceae bacterium]